MWPPLRVTVCLTGVRRCLLQASSKGRPWTTMAESTYPWKVQPFALWTPPGVSCEAKIASEPEALTAWLRNLGLEIVRIGLEAGPLSQWLYAGMKQAGLS